jgi:hypothetical protein
MNCPVRNGLGITEIHLKMQVETSKAQELSNSLEGFNQEVNTHLNFYIKMYLNIFLLLNLSLLQVSISE